LDEDFYDLDNMDEEKKVLIKEVLKDYEDEKKENLELRENALNTIAEKEMANIDLRDKIEQMKEKYNAEIHKLMLEVQDYRSKCMDVTKHTNEEVIHY
jgi:predicted  nucleic acid-binding Zn-ribbon protein